MTWSAVFVAFYATHQFGDFLVQTDWQAMHKRGGLGRDPIARRALFTHASTYTATFVPVLIWISTRLGWDAALIAGLIWLPHVVQDDGRLLGIYIRRVKRMDPAANRNVAILIDQALHMVALFGTALLVSAMR